MSSDSLEAQLERAHISFSKVKPGAKSPKTAPTTTNETEGDYSPMLRVAAVQPRSDRADQPQQNRMTPLVIRVPDGERIQRIIKGVAGEVPNEKCAQCLHGLAMPLSMLLQALSVVVPLYLRLYRFIFTYVSSLHLHLVSMLFGAALCFCGGTFAASIAAIEAFRMMGWQTTYKDILVISEAISEVRISSELDDRLDEDDDGMADVDQLSGKDLAKRKILLGFRAVKKAELLKEACSSLLAAYLAVLATLRLQFARSLSVGMAIAEMIELPVAYLIAPALRKALGPSFKHWTETILASFLNLVTFLAAWYLQMIITAFYSAIRGGKIFAHALLAQLAESGLIKKVPCIAQPFDPNVSILDEGVAFTLAAAGFTYQLTSGFSLPLVVDVVLFPLEIVEWIIRWHISFGTSVAI